MTDQDIRMGTLADRDALTALRAQWMDSHFDADCAVEPWRLKACARRDFDTEEMLRKSLAGEDDRWAAVAGPSDTPEGYVLCLTHVASGKLYIRGHTPRVAPGLDADAVGGRLLTFAQRRDGDLGLERVEAWCHGYPDEVSALVSFYAKHGFQAGARCEMVSNQLAIDPGPAELDVRTAGEIGEQAYHECEVAIGAWPTVEESRENCDYSRRHLSMQPETDWLVGYDTGNPVAAVRVGMHKDGVGTVDDIVVAEPHRGRGVGQHMLSRGLAALASKTDVCRLQCDEDVAGFYERLGCVLHHRHVCMEADPT